MSDPSRRKQRRAKRARRKKGKGHAGQAWPQQERLMPPLMSPEQIEAMFAPIREAFADAGSRGEAATMAPDPGIPDAGLSP